MTTYAGVLYSDDHAAVKVALWDWLSGGRSADAPGVLQVAWRTWHQYCHESPVEAFAQMELDGFELPGDLSFAEESDALIDVITDLETMIEKEKQP